LKLNPLADERKIEEAISEASLLYDEIVALRLEKRRIVKEQEAVDAAAEEAAALLEEEKLKRIANAMLENDPFFDPSSPDIKAIKSGAAIAEDEDY
jgi:hypothetical protein